MIIQLESLPEDKVLGIYKVKGQPNLLPARMRFLHPDAAAAYLQMVAERPVRVSDMFRSADGSLQAVKEGRGALPPAYSGHNYGFSIDVDVDWMLKKSGGGFGAKKALDEFLAKYGWSCFFLDSRIAKECWHYNYDVKSFVKAGETKTTHALERKIQKFFAQDFALSSIGLQEGLKKLKLYSGEIDGKIGPLSRAAIGAFQKTWSIKPDDMMKTKRTLAFLTAEFSI